VGLTHRNSTGRASDLRHALWQAGVQQCSRCHCADTEEAYARGDHATAFKLPLAEQGSLLAQRNIARMYERGEWVAKDPALTDE
jgi:TPR repeat protein